MLIDIENLYCTLLTEKENIENEDYENAILELVSAYETKVRQEYQTKKEQRLADKNAEIAAIERIMARDDMNNGVVSTIDCQECVIEFEKDNAENLFKNTLEIENNTTQDLQDEQSILGDEALSNL